MRKLLISIAQWGGVSARVRAFILNIFGHKVTAIYSDCIFGRGNGRIFMGAGSYINSGCYLDLNEDIIIGSNTSIAPKCIFITTTHNIGNSEKRAGKTKLHSIHIGDGCWIGANTTVLPGVTIGDGVVVGAGSLVTRDLVSNGLYYGRPAKLIRILE